LTISPGTLGNATITATAYAADNVIVTEIGTGSVNVQLGCNFISVVLTADPNVIQCGGTTDITATVRDPEGHVVPGVGFHFTTNEGLLQVGPPNDAAVENASAVLTIFPGMKEATVYVSVGAVIGDVTRKDLTGYITVQQFCRDLDPEQQDILTTAPNAIRL